MPGPAPGVIGRVHGVEGGHELPELYVPVVWVFRTDHMAVGVVEMSVGVVEMTVGVVVMTVGVMLAIVGVIGPMLVERVVGPVPVIAREVSAVQGRVPLVVGGTSLAVRVSRVVPRGWVSRVVPRGWVPEVVPRGRGVMGVDGGRLSDGEQFEEGFLHGAGGGLAEQEVVEQRGAGVVQLGGGEGGLGIEGEVGEGCPHSAALGNHLQQTNSVSTTASTNTLPV